ncbi:NPCBM/NEW2 domain protein [Symmachiella dynata]|uniref:NPCBM/NEW2 domain protein n=1 Tax=Symmachiella dynata TaxID=2527995 RepID=A0A517ZS90_9PLAN|nr:NPCBM/NEW2 domain protein [Symmachiella dynata]
MMRHPGSMSALRTLCGWILLVTAAIPLRSSFAEEMVSIESVNGTTYTGSLSEVTAEHVIVAGKSTETIPIADVIRIDWPERRVASLSGQDLVLLANGDRLVMDPVQTDNEILRAKWREFPGLPLSSIPLEMVQGIAWKLPQDRVSRSGVITRLLNYSAKTDLLTLRNGNSVAGEFLGFNVDTLKLETAAGPLDIDLKSLNSLSFNPELIAFPKSQGVRLIVTLIDGSRFTATQFQYLADAGMQFTMAFGGQATFALDRIAAMQVVGGRAVYLSDLKPRDYTFTPYLSLRWPLRTDRNATGESLRVGGREYAKGLGTHSQAEITYALDGNYSQFQAVVGIDDHAGRGGNAIAEVLVDEKLVWTSDPLTSGGPPQRIDSIDLSGAQALTLRVLFGQRGDVQDHVDWCDALLVKQPK